MELRKKEMGYYYFLLGLIKQSQNMGGMVGYDPLKDPNIEYMMKIQQLNMIGSCLLDLYPNDQVIKNYVESAMQMLASNNINGGAETLQVGQIEIFINHIENFV